MFVYNANGVCKWNLKYNGNYDNYKPYYKLNEDGTMNIMYAFDVYHT